MKDLSPLQIYAKYYINLQEKVTVNEKRQVYNFIDNASTHQLIALLTEGKMRAVKTIEETLLESKFNKSGVGFLAEIDSESIAKYAQTARIHGKAAMTTAKDYVNNHSNVAKYHAGEAKDKASSWTSAQIKKLTDMAANGHMPEINRPLAAISLAALILTVGYVAYKKYFDKAEQACKTKKGTDKSACLKKFKNDAVKAQISAITKSKSSCSKSKNPKRCNDEIAKKVQKLRAKLA